MNAVLSCKLNSSIWMMKIHIGVLVCKSEIVNDFRMLNMSYQSQRGFVFEKTWDGVKDSHSCEPLQTYFSFCFIEQFGGPLKF